MAFQLEKFTQNSEALDWGDLDLDEFDRTPLDADTLRRLRYMADVEYHTVCYMRDMLVTPSHRDGDVATFMTFWNREEFWHGEALAAVLGKHGITVDYDELKASRLKLGWKDRIDPIKQSLLGNIVGGDFIATHMTWGAANEYSAAAGYNRLAAQTDHPVLAKLLKRIAAQESRHIAFYVSQARERLERSVVARKLTRFALSNFWAPVGSGVMEPAEVDFMMHIFGGVEGRREVMKIDDHIARLPGLSGLTIFQDALDKRGIN